MPLVLLLGVAPHTAIGTDLLYASLTKAFGVGVHSLKRRVDWQVFRRLALATKWVPGQRRKSRDELMAEGVTIQHELVTSFGPVPNRLAVGLLTLSAIVLDATVMWCALAATYGPITFEVVVLAYTVAMVVTWVPLLPSGLGLVEFVVPLVLHRFGVPVATGLAGVLLWRAVSLFLPALAGLGVYGTLRVRRSR